MIYQTFLTNLAQYSIQMGYNCLINSIHVTSQIKGYNNSI